MNIVIEEERGGERSGCGEEGEWKEWRRSGEGGGGAAEGEGETGAGVSKGGGGEGG